MGYNAGDKVEVMVDGEWTFGEVLEDTRQEGWTWVQYEPIGFCGIRYTGYFMDIEIRKPE